MLSVGMDAPPRATPSSKSDAAEQAARRACEDHGLLQRFTAGEADALEAIVAGHGAALFNFILRSVRDRARAEDLTQEVWLRMVRGAERFEGRANLTTWMYTIARNLCIDESRRMAHRRHASLDAPPVTRDGSPYDGARVDLVAGHTPDSEQIVVARDAASRVAVAVEALRPEQREVLLLRHLEAMPFAQIAALTGVPLNTVKSRMRYALERLADALAEPARAAREAATGDAATADRRVGEPVE